jgi:hypothetical protein
MATFKTISSADIKSTRSYLNQLVDFVEQDVSSSATRKKYKVFLTSSISTAAGVTSSLFQTVYDQDYTLQTANPLFDITMGIFSGSSTVANAVSSPASDTAGKLLFPSQTLMMREKVNMYRQFAQLLLGDASLSFSAPFSSTTTGDSIDEALFLCHKRLFVRDGVKRETFAMRFYQSTSFGYPDNSAGRGTNISVSAANPASGSAIFTDVGSATSQEASQTGGTVGNVVDASNTNRTVGLMFYQQGITVLDLAKVVSASQHMSGVISSIAAEGRINPGIASPVATIGTTFIGRANFGNPNAKFIPDFVVSASMDDILTHIAATRFGSGSNTVMTYQNNTQINSTLVFCRATADEFNYSTNPTYTDENGRIIVIDETQQNVQKGFSFVTSVGLFDANSELLALAKLSRPVEKNDEKDLTFRVRLDF